MPKKKRLEKQIERKLTQLEELLSQIEEAHAINSDDPETWDSDSLYNLAENCKEILQLLEDKKSKTEKDNFGEPLILEERLCSLVDEYQSEEEEPEDF